MRILSLILIFTLAAPPLQLVACEHGKDASANHHAHHSMASPADAGSEHDCCDPAADVNDSPCSHSLQCGACPAAGFVGPAGEPLPITWPVHQQVERDTGAALPSHSLPPFRPPTASILS